MLDEEDGGKVTKSFQYSPWGQRLSQVTYKADGSTEDAYYSYNAHTDVEQVTDSGGDTKATYGYTAYGDDDDAHFTGIDKPDVADPTKEPYDPYRFNGKRWDPDSQSYDMGFRDYSPGLNRFLSRDSYNGALDDLNLSVNPWTGSRYSFGGGNPISAVEFDGHCWSWAQKVCDAASTAGNWVSENGSALAETAAGAALTMLAPESRTPAWPRCSAAERSASPAPAASPAGRWPCSAARSRCSARP
ncbi:MAG TPA: RHS repeat-associated core domain-containing protein [Actinoplanes sp.]|nr:RHS repeat-associated core domain-containing protein [Actinoplanes sp.]